MIRTLLLTLITGSLIWLSSCATVATYPAELMDQQVQVTLLVNEPGGVTIVNDQRVISMGVWALENQNYVERKFEHLLLPDYRSMLGNIISQSVAKFDAKLNIAKVLTPNDFGKLPFKSEKQLVRGKTGWDFSKLKDKISTRFVLVADTEKWFFSAGPKDEQDKAQSFMVGSTELEIGFTIVDLQTDEEPWYARFKDYAMILDKEDMENHDILTYFTEAATKVGAKLATYLDEQFAAKK